MAEFALNSINDFKIRYFQIQTHTFIVNSDVFRYERRPLWIEMKLKTEFSREIFTGLNIILPFTGFWATLHLPWKTECALKFFTVLNILFTFRIFKHLVLAVKISVPWICTEYIVFIIQNFEQLLLALKNSLPWTFSVHWNIFYLSGFSSNLRLRWGMECALNSLY